MTEAILVAGSALWLGVLTSVSPCPLATNIAAISFVGRRVDSPRAVLLGGVLYTLGRSFAYAVLGAVLVYSLLSASSVSLALQKHMNRILGPLLIVTGMVLLDLLPLKLPGSAPGARAQGLAERGGTWGAGLLGILFALSFCPISAALFFGSLLPLAIANGSAVLVPSIYGIGTGLPVLVFAVALGLGAGSLAGAFRRVAAAELWARRITGVIFIGVGVYMALVHVFRVL
ncbi:aromatic aminobenezylarsenical efflux permease ArsG family transporter [bacterium]|nr:aromatic aminobenezylarsenical efflux permease ArsG family transporter [bacterium]